MRTDAERNYVAKAAHEQVLTAVKGNDKIIYYISIKKLEERLIVCEA